MNQSATPLGDGGAVRIPELIFRLLWIALRLFAVLCVGQSGARFFYQGF